MSKRDKLRFKEMAKAQNGKVPVNENEILYVLFFNVLEAAKVFDKDKIKKKLAGTSILNDFSDSCSYLYHAILRALQAANDDTISEVADVTTQIKVLIYKGLHHHISPLYEQAIAFASETEDFADMLKLIQLWKVALTNANGEERRTGAFQALKTHEDDVWEKLLNLHEWEQLFDRWVMLRGLQGEKRADTMRYLENHPLMVNSGPCFSIKAQVTRMLIQERPLTNLYLGNVERIPKLIEISNLIEQHQQLLADTLMVTRYLTVVSSIGILGADFHQDSTIALAIDKLEKFDQNVKGTDAMVFERVEEIRLIVLRNSMVFDESGDVIERILRGIEFYGERITRRRRLYFYIGIAEIYLLTERPNLVAKLIAPILNDPPLRDSPRPNILLWVYYLIAEYDLDQTDIMRNWAVNGFKYLADHGIEEEAGIALMQFLRRLSRKQDLAKRKAELLKFKKEVLPLLESTANKFYIIRFPFEDWADCKLTNRRFPIKYLE